MVLPGLSPDMELTEEKSGAASTPICKDLLIYRPPFRWIGVGMDFTVKARRAESETEAGRFVGTGPRTVDRGSRRSPDGGAVPGRALPGVDALEKRPFEGTVDLRSERFVRGLDSSTEEADRPAAPLDEPGDEVADRSFPWVVRWWRTKWVPVELAVPVLLVAGLPVAGAAERALLLAGAAEFADDADVADPPEVRS